MIKLKKRFFKLLLISKKCSSKIFIGKNPHISGLDSSNLCLFNGQRYCLSLAGLVLGPNVCSCSRLTK